MDLVRVERLEDPERTRLLFGLALEQRDMEYAIRIPAKQCSLVYLDAQQGRSLAKSLVDPAVDLALVSHRGFERPQQSEGPAVLAAGQIEAPGTLLTREDVDVVGRDTALLEGPHRCRDLVFALDHAGHPVDEREQMAARVGIAIEFGPWSSLNELGAYG